MRARSLSILILSCACSLGARAQDSTPATGKSIGDATAVAKRELKERVAELDRLREEIKNAKIPLSRELNQLESKLIEARAEYSKVSRDLTGRTVDLSNLNTKIKERREESSYIANLFGQYLNSFESRLHIAELNRYEELIEAAKLAPENGNLSDQEIFEAQAALLSGSIERLEEALGGSRFEGDAVDADGLVKRGTFILVGPTAIFRSADGARVGTAEQRLGSLEPRIIPFAKPEDAQAAEGVAINSVGRIPFDATEGKAHKMEAVRESFLEHVKKGGPVMIPIFGLAGLALLIALYKWISLALLRKPSQKKIKALLQAVSQQDEAMAKERATEVKGPIGGMLRSGVEYIREPRDLIEEVMHEKVLTTRLKLQSLLPFIAICAASAPLLGLLGTVTGIINTFKLITAFGTGDVNSLSQGISEALITTKFGLIVAIPSLLIHAFLSRKVYGVIAQMETVAITFANQVSRFMQSADELPRALMPAPTNGVDKVRPEVPAEDTREGASVRPEVIVPQPAPSN